MGMKILHKNISEEEIPFVLVGEEVGEACILSQIIKIFINPNFSQELITRLFTQPNLRSMREIVLGLIVLFTLLILRASAR